MAQRVRSWVVRLNQGGRFVAMLIFVILGFSLLFPSIPELMSRPLVRAGESLQDNSSDEAGIGKSLVLGVSTGLLWALCAGPILGLILTGAAIEGAGARSSLFVMFFVLGATVSLARYGAGHRLYQLIRQKGQVEDRTFD